jgi:glutathione S-transferase
MLKLYGFAVSHYYNKVKFALLEKEIPFEEHLVWAGEADLALSPMGKLPYLGTPHGPICESDVILDYIEQQYPRNPLVPSDAFQAAKVKEIARFIDWYLEWVARPLYPEAFMGGKVSDEVKDKALAQLEKAAGGLGRLAKFSPFAAGDTLTLADCSAVTHLPVVALASQVIYGRNVLAALPISDYMVMMGQRPSVQRLMADRQQNIGLLGERLRAASRDQVGPTSG